MSEHRTTVRKIGYVAAVAALLLPLSYLSLPATSKSKGGLLAQYRESHNLSQASLGEIDPASETMKLATVGLRGVAVYLLWDKAIEFKKVEDWTNLSATLEQIARLQPNFISVWQFQGWNLSYNVAVEFDDYHDRYRWIIKGINFLKTGTHYNEREPRLPRDIAWFISHKIGTADEKVQYRQLFREDDDFHAADDPNRRRSERDNWLVGMNWYTKAEKLVDDLGVPIRGTSPLVFYSNRAMCPINYAEALEDDGVYGDVARVEWEKANKVWTNYGNRDIPTTYNIPIRLNDQERLQERAKETVKQLDELAGPDTRENIRQERMAKLTPAERELVEMPRDKRPVERMSEGAVLENRVTPTQFDVAERARKGSGQGPAIGQIDHRRPGNGRHHRPSPGNREFRILARPLRVRT